MAGEKLQNFRILESFRVENPFKDHGVQPLPQHCQSHHHPTSQVAEHSHLANSFSQEEISVERFWQNILESHYLYFCPYLKTVFLEILGYLVIKMK